MFCCIEWNGCSGTMKSNGGKVGDNNAVICDLILKQLLENSDETFVIDNKALYNISHNIIKQQQTK